MAIPNSFGKVKVVNTIMRSLIFNALFIRNLTSLFSVAKFLKIYDRWTESMKVIVKRKTLCSFSTRHRVML